MILTGIRVLCICCEAVIIVFPGIKTKELVDRKGCCDRCRTVVLGRTEN